MSSSKDFRDFIIEQSGLEGDLQFKPMMGEYLLYYQGKHIGGIFDDRLLVKKTKMNESLNLPEAIPYHGAKAMLQVDADDREQVRNVIIITAKG